MGNEAGNLGRGPTSDFGKADARKLVDSEKYIVIEKPDLEMLWLIYFLPSYLVLILPSYLVLASANL